MCSNRAVLGWHILIFRQAATGREQLAEWETSLGGTAWLDALVKQNKAVYVEGNGGYPMVYTASAGVLASALASGPPGYAGPTVVGDDYVKPSGWIGGATIDAERLGACEPDEELTIHAWDL